jgi:uncharacterized membrane protein YphA (DoxX/SURF4 family)
MEYVNLIVACAFFAASIVNLIGPNPIRAEFAKWGYPASLRIAVALVELAGSLLMIAATTRRVGVLMLLLVTMGVVISLVRLREWMRMQYPFVLFFLLVVLIGHTPVTA